MLCEVPVAHLWLVVCSTKSILCRGDFMFGTVHLPACAFGNALLVELCDLWPWGCTSISQLANLSKFSSQFCHPWDQCRSSRKMLACMWRGADSSGQGFQMLKKPQLTGTSASWTPNWQCPCSPLEGIWQPPNPPPHYVLAAFHILRTFKVIGQDLTILLVVVYDGTWLCTAKSLMKLKYIPKKNIHLKGCSKHLVAQNGCIFSGRSLLLTRCSQSDVST